MSCFSREDWHYCAACEAVAPPRAWHCTTCRQVRQTLMERFYAQKFECFVFSVFWRGSTTACLLGTVLATSTIGKRIDSINISLTSFVFKIFYTLPGLDLGWSCLLHVSKLCLCLYWGQKLGSSIIKMKNNLYPLAGRFFVPLLSDEVYLPPAHPDDWDGHLLGSGKCKDCLSSWRALWEIYKTWIVHWVQSIQLCSSAEKP